MVILRCTSKLRERLKRAPSPEISNSTTLLGDWYCHLMRYGRSQAILCVNERSRLPIFVPAREAQTFPLRLQETLAWVLTQYGIPAASIVHELSEMETTEIAATASRSVLGSLNDFHQLAEAYLAARPLTWAELSMELAETPCSPLNYARPEQVTKRYFGLE